MTITKTGSESSAAGNDISVDFVFLFRFFDDTDLKVYVVDDSTNVSTLQTLTTDYTIVNTGTESGGTITMVTPPATGETLLIQREIPETQGVDYAANDAFPAETHEAALDRLTLLSQEKSRGHITLPDGDSASSVLDAASSRASRLQGYDSNGNLLTYSLTPVFTAGDTVIYDSVAALKASTESSRGVGAIWKAGVFQYIEVASGGNLITDGGVHLNAVRSSEDWITADQLDIVGDDSTEVSDDLQSLFNLGGKIQLGKDKLYVIDKRLTFPSDFELDGNGAQIRATLTGFSRGSTPFTATMFTPETFDTVDGTAWTDDFEIYGVNFVVGSDLAMTGVYIGSARRFRIHDNTFTVAAGQTAWVHQMVVDHAARNGKIYDNYFFYEGTFSLPLGAFGACAATRNTSIAADAYVDNITWENNYFYKNCNTTDEIYWLNGGTGVSSNIKHFGNHYETGPTDIGASDVTVYNFSDSEAITTSLVRDAVFSGNTFKPRGAITKNAMIVGFIGDVRPVEGVLISDNVFDIDDNTGLFQLSPVDAVLLANNVCLASDGIFALVFSTLAGQKGLSAKGNDLHGSYDVAFSSVAVVENNWCEDCTQFSYRPLVCKDNIVDIVRLNFVEITAGSDDAQIKGNRVNVEGYVSGTIRATFYLTGSGRYDIKDNDIRYNSDDSWQIYYANAGTAPNVYFERNILNFGAAGSIKPQVQQFSTPIGGSQGNWFFDRHTDSYPLTTTSFGISGYLPHVGHIKFADDQTAGTAVEIAQIYTAAGTKVIKADVV